ncbi:MAG: hypothetical protein JST80_02785 [Bdellovibrionales bacterium]|nr:hypothetical protein [Bdellovibrionales bacterium]
MKSVGLLLRVVGVCLLTSATAIAALPEDFTIRRGESPRAYRARIVKVMAQNAQTDAPRPALTSDNVFDAVNVDLEKEEIFREALDAYANYYFHYPLNLSEEMLEQVEHQLHFEMEMYLSPTRIYADFELGWNFTNPAGPHYSHWILEELNAKLPYPVLADYEAKELYEFYATEIHGINERRIFMKFAENKFSNVPWYKRLLGVMLAQTEDPNLARQALNLLERYEDELVPLDAFKIILASALVQPTHKEPEASWTSDSKATQYLKKFNHLPAEYMVMVNDMIKQTTKSREKALLGGLKVLRYIVANNTVSGGSRICNIIYSIQDRLRMTRPSLR